MLTFNLKKEWYEKIRSGEKTIVYCEAKPYWTARLRGEYPCYTSRFYIHLCVLRLGCTKQYMTAGISKIEELDGKGTDLHIDKPVYAIHLVSVKEAE